MPKDQDRFAKLSPKTQRLLKGLSVRFTSEKETEQELGDGLADRIAKAALAFDPNKPPSCIVA